MEWISPVTALELLSDGEEVGTVTQDWASVASMTPCLQTIDTGFSSSVEHGDCDKFVSFLL